MKRGPKSVRAAAPGGASIAAEALERRLRLSAAFIPAPGSPVAVGKGPDTLAVGDFNGDGMPDLAVANASDDTASALLNAMPAPLPTGTLGAAVSATLPASVVGGAKAGASAVVTVTAPAGAAVNGPVAGTNPGVSP